MKTDDRLIETTTQPHASDGTMTAEASDTFVLSERVQNVTERALAYLALGYPVHLSGPPGTGKTTLAFHIAAQLARPVSLIHGNDDFGTSDLIGKDSGYTKSTVIDNYISSVLKTNEDLSVKWCDNRLTTACQEGHTLIYDEFNRTRPEANNILLSILEEGVLNLPRSGGEYLMVHPKFRVVFTSNPEEFAGVHRTADALYDRLITIDVGHHEPQIEADISHAKSGLDPADCLKIANIAATLRGRTSSGYRPTVRACIAFASMLASMERRFDPSDTLVCDVAWDIFGSACNMDPESRITREELDQILGAQHNPQRQVETAGRVSPARSIKQRKAA